MALAGGQNWRSSDVISFPNWDSVLTNSTLESSERAEYRGHILTFLRFCKQTHAAATVGLIRHYLTTLKGSDAVSARSALRWFFRASRQESDSPVAFVSPVTSTITRAENPPTAATDLGGADWERDLIAAARRKGFLWRTEQTYREWAVRFSRFLAPRSPYAADGADVATFLSELAVKSRASRSTQRQALNALVFLMEEALRRELGELHFRHARARKKIPTVLTTGECQRMFNQLTDTSRLMAELMYGSGLRLMELLRLRIHHLDLERQQLQVYAGKGNKDRLTILPAAVIKPLQLHLIRLRELHARDRASLARSMPTLARRGSGSGCSPPEKPVWTRRLVSNAAIICLMAPFKTPSEPQPETLVSTNG